MDCGGVVGHRAALLDMSKRKHSVRRLLVRPLGTTSGGLGLSFCSPIHHSPRLFRDEVSPVAHVTFHCAWRACKERETGQRIPGESLRTVDKGQPHVRLAKCVGLQ